MKLVRYEAACRALAECKTLDEVKGWSDKAAALQAYGRMAKDKSMEIDAAEIRLRAERRLGEMLAAQKAQGGLNTGVRMSGSGAGANNGSSAVVTNDHRPKLSDVGISKDLSSRAQKLAAVPEAEFEAEVGEWRERVSVEGQRVTARLQKAGEKALQDQEAAAEDFGPSEEEVFLSERAIANDMETVRLILESDDALAAMTEKCKQQAAMLDKQEWRIRGLVNEASDLTRRLKAAMNKLAKLEKAAA